MTVSELWQPPDEHAIKISECHSRARLAAKLFALPFVCILLVLFWCREGYVKKLLEEPNGLILFLTSLGWSGLPGLIALRSKLDKPKMLLLLLIFLSPLVAVTSLGPAVEIIVAGPGLGPLNCGEVLEQKLHPSYTRRWQDHL